MKRIIMLLSYKSVFLFSFFIDGEFQYDVDEMDDISLHSFPQYPAHLQRFDSNTSIDAITRQSKYCIIFKDVIFLNHLF